MTMKSYVGTKYLNAKPMTLGDYNALRGWTIPEGEDPAAEGYLVEYKDGGKANHPEFAGYISWSPKDVFERTYKEDPEAEKYLSHVEGSGPLPGEQATS